MLASELIVKLQAVIEKHGDYVVALEVDGQCEDLRVVESRPDVEWIYLRDW